MPRIMLLVKAFHIIAVVTWFAALLYLPRLFIYHIAARDEGDNNGSDRFKLMERKLYFGIMTPSVAVVFILGVGLYAANYSYYLSSLWMWIKLALVISLLAFHIQCGRYLRRLAANLPVPSTAFFRWFNEYPVLVLVVVVVLVELQPRLV